MFSDTQELANFGLLALGIDPAKSTADDWDKAGASSSRSRSDQGIVRKYYDQGYVDALGQGEVWITQAWSGDIFQKNVSDGTDFEFVVPEEGGTIWTDNMRIPITAKNPVDALELMDFFYQLEIAATLAEYINYIMPGARRQGADHARTRRSHRRRQDVAGGDREQPAGLPVRGRLRQAALLRLPSTPVDEQQDVPDRSSSRSCLG